MMDIPGPHLTNGSLIEGWHAPSDFTHYDTDGSAEAFTDKMQKIAGDKVVT